MTEMANPQIYGPDGVLREEVVFSTTSENRFFSGTIPQDAFDVQVSINGSGFSSDPSLAQWGDGNWVVPNPTAEPDGLVLLPGENIVEVRAILPSGSTTSSCKATVRLVSSENAGVVASPPTNISLEQYNAFVSVSAEPSSDSGFQGLNFYASVSSGGGASGYTRINVNTVDESSTVDETQEFGEILVDAAVPTNPEGEVLADPLYFRVIGRQEDEDEVVLSEDLDEKFVVPETATTVRLSGTLSSVRRVQRYSFDHYRSAGPSSLPATTQVGAFSSLPNSEPLYYVVTAVYYDSTQNLEFESSYSEEVLGSPTQVTTAIASLPTTSRQAITQQFIQTVFRSNPQIKMETGSVLRDTVIDPFASESERLRFVLDFFHRARTPSLLLQVDDPSFSGTSVSVANSPYKQALQGAFYLTSSAEVQSLIDTAFEAYANNFGVSRRAGSFAQGEVVFYTTTRPNATVVIPLGTTVTGGGVSFATTRAASIPLSQLASFYNPISGRYQVTAPVRATLAGSAGNVGVGQVRSLSTTLNARVFVINAAAMVGGSDDESNLALTTRVQNRLASVDSGTERGYLQTAADTAGVVKANVVAAGDPLMQRDLNSAGEHKGGKVDVWVQGSNLATVTDTFAFTFEVAQDIQFELISNPSGYRFRAVDPNLSEDNPIIEMLDDSVLGYEFRNASTGDVFDLTGVVIESYNTIVLDTSIAQPAVTLTDVVVGSYRRRQGSTFVLPRQPVESISSVEGTVSGEIPTASYSLVRPNPPLQTGRSALAGDYIEIESYEDSDGNLVPSGDTITVTNEVHTLVGSYPEFLDSLGANFLSLKVYSQDRTVEYKGPNDPSGAPDYSVDLGTQTQALSITRLSTGTIPSGATVSVDYQHDENFTVTYSTNLIVSLAQNALDEKKHATADVLAKEAVAIPLDVDATIVLIRGREKSTVDTALRTNMANFFSNLRLGDPVRQSDVIDVIEQTDGVSYVVVPLTKMVPADDTLIVREEVSTDTAAESTFIQAYTTNSAIVYLLNESLEFSTTNGGGSTGEFRGVFQDDIALTLLEASQELTALGVEPGRAYILGSAGRAIAGFSDDATLEAEGYVTDASKEARRREITANRVLVSLAVGTSPTQYTYAVTYVVSGDEGAKNVDPGGAQYVAGGDLLFTYDEDR